MLVNAQKLIMLTGMLMLMASDCLHVWMKNGAQSLLCESEELKFKKFRQLLKKISPSSFQVFQVSKGSSIIYEI